MNVFVQGVGDVALNNSNFIFQGGEGSIYAKGDSAYKIYTDPKKMIPSAKINELQAIDDDKVIRPKHLLLDKKNSPIGYSMRYLKDTSALCQLFTKAFRDRNKIQSDTILQLIQGMRHTVENVHSKKILIVDLNEMNFLVDSHFKEVYFIDVDSYQTKNFPATALMESVRDRHAKGFSEGSDWFSFAVVSFQMFIGIHPYKGKHSSYTDIDSRMIHNVSVLNKDVTIPKICQPFDVIPEVYRRWYAAVLEKGDRLAPPKDLIAHVNVIQTVKKVMTSDKFDIKLLFPYLDLDGDVIGYIAHNGCSVTTTVRGIYVDSNYSGKSGAVTEVGFSPKMNYVIEGCLEDGFLTFNNLSLRKKCRQSEMKAKAIMGYGGRVYAMSGSNVLEILFTEMSDEVVIGSKVVTKVLEQATSMFRGVVIQNLLGSYYASVFPKSSQSYQVKLPELDKYRIVDAKFDSRVLIVVGSKHGEYDKFIFRFDKDFQKYDVRVVKNIAIIDINFVTLDNGIVASINDKENLELFGIVGNDIKEIESPAITSDMALFKDGTSVLFAKGKEIYTLKMKGN